jgi:hypothetical protein
MAGELQRLTIHIDSKIAKRFKAACKKSRYSMSELLEEWALKYAEKIEKSEDGKRGS